MTGGRGGSGLGEGTAGGIAKGWASSYIRAVLQSNPIHALVISASLGALIGLVRQWEYEKKHPGAEAPAGLRTFTAWALLGCGAGLLEMAGAAWVFSVGLAVFTLVLGAIHLRNQPKMQVGLTTFSVGVLTYVAGGLASYGKFVAAASLSVGAMLILGSKEWSHAWTKKMTAEDLRYLLQFAAFTGLVLPLVPDESIGPYQAFNPHTIWLMVVLVAGLGFAGYVAVRWLGARAGILLTGLAGGLASSTVTTMAFGRQSLKSPSLSASLAVGAVLASVVMAPRGLIMVAVINPDVALPLLIPFGLMSLPGLLWVAWGIVRHHTHHRSKHEVDPPALGNPLSPAMALKFGLLYAVIAFIVKVAAQKLPSEWLYGVSFVSGLTDINAITVSSAQAASAKALDPLAPLVAARCVLLGSLANTGLKAVLAGTYGSPVYMRTTASVLAASAALGALGWWWMG